MTGTPMALAVGIIDETAWGRLVWQVSGSQLNSEALTFGRCFINPGHANSRHSHPNCEEVLSVVRGSIVHSYGDGEIAMGEGDTIVIPSGIMHNARNVGDGVAEMVIVFSSPYRRTDLEDGAAGEIA